MESKQYTLLILAEKETDLIENQYFRSLDSLLTIVKENSKNMKKKKCNPSRFLNHFYCTNFIIIKYFQHSTQSPKMYHPYQNIIDSFYFYSLQFSHPYFNYQLPQNNLKVSSNILLVDSQNQNHFNLFHQQKTHSIHPTLESSFKDVKTQDSNSIRPSTLKQFKQHSNNANNAKKQKKIKKTPRRNQIPQKEGRNSHSNILRRFFKMIFVETQVQTLVQKIIKKYQLQIEPDQFFAEIKSKDIDHRNYIRVKEVDWIFEFTENPVNKITRILFEHYLKNYYIEHLLSSKKTNNKSVGYHLQGRRNICQEIIEEGLKK